MATSRFRHILLRSLGVFLLFLVSGSVALIITGYSYVFKTLVYTYPDIDDLDIFPTRTVDDPSPVRWPFATDYQRNKPSVALSAELEKNRSVAYLVVRNDSLLYEQYWDRYDTVSPSNSFSVAKSVVGLLVGIAADEHLLELDQPIGRYLPHFNTDAGNRCSIRELLMMSSGLNWDESYASLFSYTTEAYYGSDLQSLTDKLKVVEEPGTTFRYMSGNTLLLGMILECATGERLSDYASKKLWKPLGATAPAFWSLDHVDGTEKAYCCFYSNARDFARIGQLVLDSGMCRGVQIVSKDYIRQMTTPIGLTDERGKTTDYYGYHWWLANVDGHRVVYARGILGQYIIVIPDLRMVVVRLGIERGTKENDQHYSDFKAYVRGAIEMVR
jgi:CubicO group peptidase (beta-lactamase class C family)